MKKFVSSLFIALLAFAFALPASAASEQIKLSDPLIAPAATAKAKSAIKVAKAKAKKAKKAKAAGAKKAKKKANKKA